MTAVISINGRILTDSISGIAPLDRGFTLGDGLFETIKLYAGTAWYLDRHLARLQHSAERFSIAYPAQLTSWVNTAISAANTDTRASEASLALRITLSRGVAVTPGLLGTDATPTTVIAITPAPAIPSRVYDSGLSIRIASAPRNERAYSAGHKTTSYIESILSAREAKDTGYDDALLLDTRGFVSELSASNIFAWFGDQLVTPPLECGILPGVTRDIVVHIASTRGIPTEVRPFTVQQLLSADEVFCTSSLRGIAPIVAVDHQPIGTGHPGSRTQQLIDAYAAHNPRM